MTESAARGDIPLQAAILQAARVMFASTGYATTTVKSVAAAAGVAPGVVTSLYANRDRLFAAAMRLPFDPTNAVPEMIAPGLDGMGDRIVRMSLTLLQDPQVRADLTRLARSDAASTVLSESGTGVPQMRALVEYFQTTVVDRVAAAMGIPDARLRGTLIAAQLLGVATSRYVLRVEPLASASEDEIVALVGPSIQLLLDPTSARPQSASA